MTKKPFFREFDGCWYAQVRAGSKRKQVKLRDQNQNPIRGRDNEAAAWKAFHRLMAQDPAATPEPAALKVRRLRKKLPQLQGVISYTVRHTWITDALERGVPVATVAELAGHKDLKMIQQHYAHLPEKRKHLQEAARKAAGYDGAPPEEKRPA